MYTLGIVFLTLSIGQFTYGRYTKNEVEEFLEEVLNEEQDEHNDPYSLGPLTALVPETLYYCLPRIGGIKDGSAISINKVATINTCFQDCVLEKHATNKSINGITYYPGGQSCFCVINMTGYRKDMTARTCIFKKRINL